MRGKSFKEDELRAIANDIQNYIDEHKHLINRVSNTDFAPAVLERRTGRPYNINNEAERRKYCGYIQRLKARGVLRYAQEEPNGPYRWSVNPAYLDKTGVVTYIPTSKPPKPPVIMPATAPAPVVDEDKIRNQAVAFIEEEMKKVEVEFAVVRYAGANLELNKVNLYQLYKIANSIDSVCEKATTEMLPDLPENDDSEEENRHRPNQFKPVQPNQFSQTSSEDDCELEFDQTETEDDKPF